MPNFRIAEGMHAMEMRMTEPCVMPWPGVAAGLTGRITVLRALVAGQGSARNVREGSF
jgi:hypothetical protein